MKNQNSSSRIEIAKKAISTAPAGIQEEFERTTNSWLACFGSCVDVVDTYVSGSKAEDELGTEKYKTVQVKIEELKQKLRELHTQYPEKHTIPSDDIKQELLTMLNVLQ